MEALAAAPAEAAQVAKENRSNAYDGLGEPQGPRIGAPTRAPTLRIDVSPLGCVPSLHPLSCPSRLRFSPTKDKLLAAFDPLAGTEAPGCTPLAAFQPSQPVAPRKGLADSPLPFVKRSALFTDQQPQSCPPERLGRRSRPILRVRVKRSLNLPGAGAAAAPAGPPLARRSTDSLGVPAAALPQLAGCSRKRFEAELVSPPLPRKSSRVIAEDKEAADIMARLQLAETGTNASDMQA